MDFEATCAEAPPRFRSETRACLEASAPAPAPEGRRAGVLRR